MGLLENLAQGFAGAAGNDQAVASIQKNKDDRRASQQEELHGRTKAILDDVSRLQERRAALPPGSPEIAGIDKALRDHQQAFQDLYHPTKNPGALQHLGGFLKQHITGKAPAPAPASNAVTPDRMASLQASAAGTATPDPYLTPDDLKKKARIAAGLDPAAVAPKPDSENWKTETITVNGKTMTVQHNTKDGTWLDLNNKPIPPELLSEAVIAPKQSAAPKVGSFGDFLTQAYGAHPTAKQYEEGKKLWAQSSAGTTTGTHIIQVPQLDGSIKAYEVQTTSSKTFGGVPGSAPTHSAPKTPGEVKARAAAVAPPGAGSNIVKPGDKLGARRTVTQNKLDTEYREAEKISDTADLVNQRPDDAVGQKRLAVQLERAAAGRFTTQALDYILKAGWGNTIEGWANSTTTGALPKDIVRQLVQNAHDYRDTSKKARDESFAESGNQSAPSSDADIDAIVNALNPKKSK